jgi:hypothetical protein
VHCIAIVGVITDDAMPTNVKLLSLLADHRIECGCFDSLHGTTGHMSHI